MVCLWFQYLQVKRKTVLVDGEVRLQYITIENSANPKGALEFEGPFRVVPHWENMARLFTPILTSNSALERVHYFERSSLAKSNHQKIAQMQAFSHQHSQYLEEGVLYYCFYYIYFKYLIDAFIIYALKYLFLHIFHSYGLYA